MDSHWSVVGLCLMFLCMSCRYEYRLTKEYNWNVKNKASKGYEVSPHITHWLVEYSSV